MTCTLYILPAEKINLKDPLFLRSMSPERLAKIERYASIADKKLSMAAELCICVAAKENKLPIPPKYKSEENEKPEFFVSPPYFNVSHCKGYAICAVADSPVGVDAEPADRVVDERITKRLLRSGEACPSSLWKWVEKESFVKLTGEGLRRPLSSFTSSPNGIFDPSGKCLARISRFELRGLLISVAAYVQISPTVVRILSPEHVKAMLAED